MEKILNVSIVLYNSTFFKIESLVKELRTHKCINQIYLIDNSLTSNYQFDSCDATYIFTGKNLGFGAGHNIGIKKSIRNKVKYHLILNSDIYLEKNTIDVMVAYLEANDAVGQIMPLIKNEDGTPQLLPKLLPYPLDLCIRVFPFLNRIFKKRHNLYVLKDFQHRELNVPIISGCFCIFNVAILEQTGLYDESFFMYFEDFDLSRRIHKHYKTIYFPSVSIIHLHERGATKSLKLFLVFIRSAIYYFHKYGWFFDNERKLINKEALNNLK